MNSRNYLGVARGFWRSILAITLAALAVAALATIRATPVYQANATLFVGSQDLQTGISGVYTGSLFAQQRVKSYSDIVTSAAVLERVIQELNLQKSVGDLAGEIHASAPLDTVLINIAVVDKSPTSAALIANSVGRNFSNYVGQLEAPAAGTLATVKVSVVQPATVPGTPISPKKKSNLILGLLAGLAIGFGQAFVRTSMDTRVKDVAGLLTATSLPVVGLIPFDSDAAEAPVILDVSAHSVRSEAFRQLRTNLQFIDPDNAPRSLVMTSSVPREGKSTTSANLAITMQRAGLRVVVVEADMRRPRLLQYLGISPTHLGLTDVLIGRCKVDEALVLDALEGVALLPSGTPPPNPSELLSSVAMQRVVAELESRYDVVILDAPPLLPVSDAAVLSTAADGVILVVRARSTKRDQVIRSNEILEGVDARVLGVVLNMVERTSSDAYGYYYYGNDKSAGRDSRKSERDHAFAPDRLVPAKRSRSRGGVAHPPQDRNYVADSTGGSSVEAGPAGLTGSVTDSFERGFRGSFEPSTTHRVNSPTAPEEPKIEVVVDPLTDPNFGSTDRPSSI